MIGTTVGGGGGGGGGGGNICAHLPWLGPCRAAAVQQLCVSRVSLLRRLVFAVARSEVCPPHSEVRDVEGSDQDDEG